MMMNSKTWALLCAGRIHPVGMPFVLGLGLVTLVAFWVGMAFVAKMTLLAGLLVAFFFRDPHCIPPLIPGAIVSPANGIITDILWGVTAPEDLFPTVAQDARWTCISIFLSLYDVHVNRLPVGGVVRSVMHRKGLFRPASSSHTDHNESMAILLETEGGEQVGCVQIAGILARRIVCHVQEGHGVALGDRYGIICFGSRVNVYVPQGTQIFVREGMRMMAGESVLGTFSGQYFLGEG